MKVLLAQPRGVCAGVERAVEIVEEALKRYGPPVYVRHEIVHNKYIVENFQKRGVIFVDELNEVPDTSLVIFSAHGVAPSVHEDARRRKLRAIDSTCPLVSKVHNEVVRHAQKGDHLFLIGHEGHEEVVGTLGHAPDRITLVTSVEDARTVQVPDGRQVYVVTQTTLSMDDTGRILEVLKRRFPELKQPSADDICYATQNRQNAVKEIARKVDVVLVIGSQNSSNARRLAEVAESDGVPAHLIDGEKDVDPKWLEGANVVGVTSGASTPEILVERVVDRLRELGPGEVEVEVCGTQEEHVTFQLPPELTEGVAS